MAPSDEHKDDHTLSAGNDGDVHHKHHSAKQSTQAPSSSAPAVAPNTTLHAASASHPHTGGGNETLAWDGYVMVNRDKSNHMNDEILAANPSTRADNAPAVNNINAPLFSHDETGTDSFYHIPASEIEQIRQQEHDDRYFTRVTDQTYAGLGKEVARKTMDVAEQVYGQVGSVVQERIGTKKVLSPKEAQCPCYNYPPDGWRHCPIREHVLTKLREGIEI